MNQLTLLDRDYGVEAAYPRRGRFAISALKLAVVGLLSLSFSRLAVSVPPDAQQPRDTITLTGRVLVQDKPAPRAMVYLREAPASWSQTDGGWRPSPTRNIAQTTADAEGHFECGSTHGRAATRTSMESLWRPTRTAGSHCRDFYPA
ncbi:MAG: hypothetical protein ACREHD_01120 [Pirellulales bacterium]